MKFTTAPLALALAVTTAALQITSPTQGQCVDLSQGFPVAWESVSTDPSVVSFRLTNYNGANPPINLPFPPGSFDLVDTSAGSYNFPGLSRDVAHGLANRNNGDGFEIWIVGENGGSLAQSQQFRLAAPGKGC